MKARIIAIGSELLSPIRLDTNSLAITDRLNALGIAVVRKIIVGDDIAELTRTLREAMDAVDLVVCTGGLGPTADDLTREAVADLLQIPLELDPGILEGIQDRFTRRGLQMPAINRRQAMVPRGALLLPNPVGTAPGLMLEHQGTRLLLLPGPPLEMIPMLDAVIRDHLTPAPTGGLFRRVLKITGRTESDVDSRVQPVYSPWTTQPVPIDTTILASFGQIELHLTARAVQAATATEALDVAERQIRDVLGSSVYSADGSPLEAVIGRLLAERGWTIALAESCTGGLTTSRLTDVAGSSAYVEMACVCYSNASKVEWLGVSQALIDEHGAVSEAVARAMAEGVRRRANATVGIGITGIAGPGGGTDLKPVGTVAIAVLAGDHAHVQTFRFIGPRESVKSQASQTALNQLRLLLLR
ncbi:MAG: competence/damage-inducible protein A [Vicinamibacterales bacterium]